MKGYIQRKTFKSHTHATNLFANRYGVPMLQCLREEFISYMKTWKESVEARPGYTEQQEQRNFFE